MTRTGFGLPLWPTLLVVFFSAVMLWLGFWQLQRAEEKQQLLDWLATGVDQAADRVEDAQALPRYSFVTLSGHFLTTPQFLLENKVRDKQIGLEVFTPFWVDDWQGVVLLNRGWVPARDAAEAARQVSGSPRHIRARIDYPPKTGIELGELSLDPEKPVQKMVYFQPEKIARVIQRQTALPLVLADRVFLLDAAAADGFVRDWKPVIMPPSRHMGYAVQWFGLTITLWILYFFWLRKQWQSRENPNPK